MSDNDIPPMTDPMGQYWQQPPSDKIQTDDTHALMTEHALSRLLEYSCSMPSGVYPGKMWKLYDEVKQKWMLRWYGLSDDPKKCSINTRIILTV